MIERAFAGACAVDSDPFEGDFTESGSADGGCR